MTKRKLSEFTLDERVSYEVVVAGRVEPTYLSSYATIMRVQLCEEPHDRTIITGNFDQAALHGILRGVYSRGFPLISVNRVEVIR